jgi:hypothetical protein
MQYDPEKVHTIADVISNRGVQFIKMHLTRPSPGRSASIWSTQIIRGPH